MLLIVSAMIAYFTCHWAFFGFASHMFGMRPARYKTLGIAFAVNYGLFIAVTFLMLPLPVNWTMIAVLFAVEVKVLYRVNWADCLLVALLGTALGLSSTILMRSLCSLAFDMPLSLLGNGADNAKGLSVILGFLFSAVCLRVIDIPGNRSVLATIMAERRTLAFLIVELVLCYLYLCLNLLLYESSLNSAIVKLWSIKTSVFVALGGVLAVWFSYRMASVLAFARRRETLAREIASDERASAELEELADRDTLTGCFTRDYALREAARLFAQGGRPTVVFVDLDELKAVNDRHGHEAGDAYLAAAASALQSVRASADDFVARYGGDEFLAVLAGPLAPGALAERMNVVQRSLRATGSSEGFSFEPSMSWGAATADEDEGFEDVVARADAAMYRRKRQVKAATR
ncbi:GGDEF domain-containing protein [Arabiibacter massiliensis]|uniref:GGDEF domain-containing protein n=1 Tax=Arabiibacter massiliensis TaxID=1870985 RepID=UPI0009BAEFC1|nr:diguanylate cyclase [Arabiibacter massiliensis]